VQIVYVVWATLSFYGLIAGANAISKEGKSPVIWILGAGVTVFLLAYAAYHGV
jgi:hypothetical protein